MNRTEKHNAALMTGKTMKNTWGKQSNFFIKINGKPRADTLFGLGFGVWILDLFFFGVVECDGKAMNGTEKSN